MATSKKSTTGTKTEKTLADFPKVYMRLRTVLDSLEIGTLQYCLQEKNVQKRIKRAEEIEKLIMPIIQKLQEGDNPMLPKACAEGYWNCGGVCVPYQCPTDK